MCATPVSPPSLCPAPAPANPADQTVPVFADLTAAAAAVEPFPEGSSAPALRLRWRGVESYETSFDAMRVFTDARDSETADEIWLVEHPPVFTLGQAGDPAHLLAADSGIPLVKVDRGGQITYHGPGQVVAYLLLDLRRRKLMVRELVTRIEQAVIDTLAAYNLAGERKAGAPGIYVAPSPDVGPHAGAKIGALGLKIRHGCSYHGVSLNVKMDLRPFLAINPCGYVGLETIDMATLGVAAGWDEVARTFAACLTANIDGTPAAVGQPQAGVVTA